MARLLLPSCSVEPLRDLLATDHRRALEFFVLGLTDVCEPTVDRQELLYNASVLAHFSQVSTHADGELPTPASLTAVFDHFVVTTGLPEGSLMLETAGAQCLLLTGFFERQMSGRHSIRWYADLGASFFGRASARESSPPKARLLAAISRGFDGWRCRYGRLSQELRDQAYLLSPSTRSKQPPI